MGIENLNRVHWILIGAFLGAILAYSWASVQENVEGVASSDAASFERDLIQKDPTGKYPLITGIVIHPPEFSPADDGNVNLITYKRLAKDKKGNYGWLDKRFVAKIPYKPAYAGRVTAAQDLTIEKYLVELSKKNDFIKFSNGWWLIPKNAVMLGVVAGVVVIGGAWPTLLNLLTGAGLGRRPDPNRKKEKALWKYKSTPTAASAGKPTVSAADAMRVEEITSAYEKSLGEAATETSAVATADEEKAAEIQKLETATLEKAEPIKREGDDDEIEVKGIYYPVLFHHKKGDGNEDKSKDSQSPAKKE